MICPVCKRPTTRMVYRRTGKLCADCANPNFMRILDLGPSPESERRLKEYERYIDMCHGLIRGTQPL